ncbi:MULTISPECIES: ABC transporter ATP-binding protein [unclassified Bradyrhizobium]|uniref:ABC transporter ATP-binding protein n=1 Tax=unclassified Bradyrhizobium TaxID=2631580 RepID=UPI0028F144F8|nr:MULTISPECIES: ABC transporter ATP-binding protein [unclassified Bradyrhizobium]
MANVRLDNVSVDFPVFTSRTRSVRTAVFSRLGGRLATHDDTVVVKALQQVTLELSDGDRLGVIGHNGAGKTTFLRVVSGVYPPVSGEVRINGKVSSFTDITLGMEPEATGWQNIIFRCVFLGLSFAEARELSPAIGEFSELGEYLHLPVRTYSAGMFVRLAFAISTAVRPEVVVMDEMIGTGDRSFVEKAQRRMAELLGKADLLILASHNEAIIRSVCNKVVWLENGAVRMIGATEAVMEAYSGNSQLAKVGC